MNGIIILVCGLLLLLAIKLLIERNFIGLVLFSVALFLIFGVNPAYKVAIARCYMVCCYKEAKMSNQVFRQNLDDKKGPQPGGPVSHSNAVQRAGRHAGQG